MVQIRFAPAREPRIAARYFRREIDCLLEGDEFEPSVPRQRRLPWSKTCG